jgi:ATP-dependent 26S proteasome regulatory subunit
MANKPAGLSSEFMNKVRAGYPILWVKTHEEHRALMEYVAEVTKKSIKNHESGATEKYTAFSWDVSDGVRSLEISDGCLALGDTVKDTAEVPGRALTWLDTQGADNTILFLKDYHNYLFSKDFKDADIVKRMIRNLISKFKAQGKVLCILSPVVDIPVELDKEVSVINYKLPTREDLKQVLLGVCESAGIPANKQPKPAEEESLLDAALGMTAVEAENAFSVSLIEAKGFDASVIRREKASIVKKSGTLEIFETSESLETIGGLENLKNWLLKRRKCSSSKARDFGVRPLKGVVFVGPPGTGKSLTAKASATLLGRPLLKLDLGNVMDQYVGNSEHNMTRVLEMADAISPCVLWIDEVEKDISGNKGGQESHEVSKKILKMLLNWMQEKKSDVFVVMTANQVESLPPELIRSGRIDALYWCDLPDCVQRAEIIRIHLKKVHREPTMFDKSMDKLVGLCDNFTGAEIETWVAEALVRAFDADHDDLTIEDLETTVKEITPISTLMSADIQRARDWAKGRKCKMASIDHSKPAVAGVQVDGKRKISIPVPPMDGTVPPPSVN